METTDYSARLELELMPANRASLSGTVADQLADLIVGGRLQAGERLPPERELATQLRVSRIVVREALRTLAERGLIEVRAGVGAFVVPMAPAAVTRPMSLYLVRNRVALAHLFELRRAIEPRIAAAATEAAAAGTDKTDGATGRADEAGEAAFVTPSLAALRENLVRSRAAATELDLALETTGAAPEPTVEAFAWLDLEFHQLLAAASGNPLFQLVLEPLIDRLLAVRREGARLPGTAVRAVAGHAAVLAALELGDAGGAARAMEAHLTEVESWLNDLQDREGGEA